MQLIINGETRTTEAATLADLLTELGHSGSVATAVNEIFVPAATRATQTLSPGDRIEILAPMQGG
ncbi:thiamine biosynthesis protein ThiS [Dinoroseobacter shibae DFL 12 = DSM 16493]|jgi:sulfur carrier protein|uniref:Thiamine biosynthesis protein ThiS n=1 Tax=Dinoroseobacter shibae (strain DSM 16493 / NCIMB 14021 / DFL 12) TaxID=398580 RepID=A8LRV1_DINSH|nr:sulfur carrier protein ThiS [Dinoroseobacter shibae]ABV92658.1 thiamine biosynthesis protein ThiS [Dinoroseobacter shibae DFL 12 = DSM 16493]URF47597.1 sulfur carrier protein ThiS [Dinoroseobacter shibae]URF51907.1 sulfur carrier protein ThiS [Dinoroseobacter shibae]